MKTVDLWMSTLSWRRLTTLPVAFVMAVLLSACVSGTPPSVPLPTVAVQTVAVPTVAVEPLAGEWLGGLAKSDGAVVSLLVSFSDSGGSLNVQPFKKSWDLTTLVQGGGHVAFDAAGKPSDPYQVMHFEGDHSADGLSGNLTLDGDQAQVEFMPLAHIDSASLEKHVGVYRFDSGRTVSVLLSPAYDDGKLQYFPPGLMFTDLDSGDSRGLYPLADETFGIGSARVLAYPLEDARVKFVSDESGETGSLHTFDRNAPEKTETAVRVNYSVEDATFTSEDGAVMVGLLTSPATPGVHPAFMMLHGSEAGVKDGFGQQILAHYMISKGIALLTYDKRGAGDSGGVYRESADSANINLIASDVVAGAEYLASRPEVDTDKIGLIGGSQAGWVIPVAAAQSDKVDFFVIESGPVVTLAQESRYSAATNDGETVTSYDAEKLDQSLRDMNPATGNPLPGLADLTQPGLWLWGTMDKSVPVTVSAENLQKLIDAGKDNFSYTILEGGDHNLNQSPHGYFAEIPYSPRVVYFSALARWLEEMHLSASS